MPVSLNIFEEDYAQLYSPAGKVACVAISPFRRSLKLIRWHLHDCAAASSLFAAVSHFCLCSGKVMRDERRWVPGAVNCGGGQ